MKEVALYIHIPFCKQKCLYCDFKSFVNAERYMADYIEALLLELDRIKDKYIFKSLFIGGGTPSFLDDESLSKLMHGISELEYIDNAEKTIECNPGTINEKKLSIIKEGKINRLSFGLQSTNNQLLKVIGRIHTYEEFKENYFLARKMGFNNINIDLMFGLPNQTLNMYKETLNEIVKLNPEHISAYSLIIEEETPFYDMYNKDLIKLPTEECERKMYRCTKDILGVNGYHQYEISNYSKEQRECYHNKIYWSCEEYIGIGIAASSYIDNRRITNISSIKEYIYSIKNNKSVIEEEVNNSEIDNMEEFMFMNLRMLQGVDENKFFNRFHKHIDSIYKKVIDKHIKNGLLIRDRNKIFLSEKGIELSNYVMSDFILT